MPSLDSLSPPSAYKTLGRPCKSCPWQVHARASDIPHFSLELAASLSRTCPDERGMGPDFTASHFACHQSTHGEEFACAGWLATVGHAHPGVRLAIAWGRLSAEALEPGADWPALHASHAEMLDKLRSTQAPEQASCAPDETKTPLAPSSCPVPHCDSNPKRRSLP